MAKNFASALAGKPLIKDQALLRAEDIRTRVRVLPELEALIPPLLPQEAEQLRQNLRQHGCRDPLLVWETQENVVDPAASTAATYVLIDGHNRRRICEQEGLDYSIRLVSFSSMDEVRRAMIENQLGRRNLTPEQASYLRGLRYQQEKSGRGRRARAEVTGNEEPVMAKGSTADRLGERFGVSGKTIQRDAEFAQGLGKLSPALRTEVLAGQYPLDKGDIQRLSRLPLAEGSLKSRQAVDRRLAAPHPTPAPPSDDDDLLTKLEEHLRGLRQQEGDWNAHCEAIARCAQHLRRKA